MTGQAGPLAEYRRRLDAGLIRPDPAQARMAERLDRLWRELQSYQPQPGGWMIKLGLVKKNQNMPRSVYVHGPVGRGKSMVMDLFFATAPVAAKRRVHFHEFMLECHARIHEWRQAKKAGTITDGDDPIRPLAKRIAAEAWLLCFDEFHVVDIADAMILGRLFVALFEQGVVVVSTSNWKPDDLYKDGLQRDLFLPFIAFLKREWDVLELAGPHDYRRDRIKGMPVYHHPLGPTATAALDRAFAELTDGARPEPRALKLSGRTWPLERTAKAVARLDFAEACEQARGAADYIALAEAFDTVILDGVPLLKPEKRNEAKRLMLLIDALYEHKTKLVMAADAPPEGLYTEGTGAVEFQRTVSRLMEMQSEDYLQRPHLT
ncbi:MAG TPA: cell division protein ZapE [Alphaproteobacteria bacterium]|nr:cell division protein ZapE [Alphaproteobacteria bacterium]